MVLACEWPWHPSCISLFFLFPELTSQVCFTTPLLKLSEWDVCLGSPLDNYLPNPAPRVSPASVVLAKTLRECWVNRTAMEPEHVPVAAVLLCLERGARLPDFNLSPFAQETKWSVLLSWRQAGRDLGWSWEMLILASRRIGE